MGACGDAEVCSLILRVSYTLFPAHFVHLDVHAADAAGIYVNIQFVSSIRILNKNNARARGQHTCIFDIILLLTVTIVHIRLLYELTLTTTMSTTIYILSIIRGDECRAHSLAPCRLARSRECTGRSRTEKQLRMRYGIRMGV